MKGQRKNIIKTINLYVRRRIIAFILACIFSGALVFVVMAYFVNPIIEDTGRAQIKSEFTSSVNKAVDEVMRGTITYDDLISIVTDNTGKIVLLQANSIQINALSRKVIESTYVHLMEELNNTLSIPLGSFSGIPVFSGLGPIVEVKSTPYAAVRCKFLSKFVSAGINQTVHKIYLSVDTDVSMIFPFSNIMVNETSDVLVSESLIIGEIPDTYLMAAENGDMLNMVG